LPVLRRDSHQPRINALTFGRGIVPYGVKVLSDVGEIGAKKSSILGFYRFNEISGNIIGLK
jgi:hypothetical protein